VKWALILGGVWYWWRLYSLSFSPRASGFPDPAYAEVVWNRRSTASFFLGALVFTTLLCAIGAIQVWWAIAIGFLVCLLCLVFLQPMLVGAIIFVRSGLAILRLKLGFQPRSPMLAPLAWSYYVTEEEKSKAMGDSHSRLEDREPLEKLKQYPAFQNLRAKAETHQLQFRPKESGRLRQQGKLDQVLDQRSEQAWNVLSDNRKNGMNLNEAEELALPYILLPSEKEEEEARLDHQERTEGQ
jgi:hypothetical protein